MLGTVPKESVIFFSFSFSPILKGIVFLCIFAYSDTQHFAVLLSLVFRVVFVYFVCSSCCVLCTKCCQFLWIVNSRWPLRFLYIYFGSLCITMVNRIIIITNKTHCRCGRDRMVVGFTTNAISSQHSLKL